MSKIVPFCLKDTPALIEHLLPVQKLSAESYKEQMAVHGKTLTGLGSYWKGRKPLVLNKACVLGCLLPATGNDQKDLEIFEKLMGMDDESFAARAKSKPTPKDILAKTSIANIAEYFACKPEGVLPKSSPIDFSDPNYANVKVEWRDDIALMNRRNLEARLLPKVPYRDRVESSKRAEEVPGVHDHIWDAVNRHLGTEAHTFPELVEQLGIMRFGHRPILADPFSGSGQIPFEAARLGCDVHASDLNPIACLLTWGAFNIVGASPERAAVIQRDQAATVARVRAEVDRLGIEDDGAGWRAKVYLYCLEAVCPQTGWRVPLIPNLIVSKGYHVVAKLRPIPAEKRYAVDIIANASAAEMHAAENGTVQKDGRGQDPYLIHTVEGKEYRTKISTLRGDFRAKGAKEATGNRLRQWEVSDFKPRTDDIFQERLYAVQWMRPKGSGKQMEYEFRAVTPDDEKRERIVEDFLSQHLSDWQAKGWIPDMRIEPGAKTDEPIRTRGWTHWHHLFNPRQLLLAGLVRQAATPEIAVLLMQGLNCSSRMCVWHRGGGGGGLITQVFYNQALNTLYDYGCRAFDYAVGQLQYVPGDAPIPARAFDLQTLPADEITSPLDFAITDPPYGDAVHYEEILDFFIAWLRKDPPEPFKNWTWDSRRALAIKGAGEEFRQGMARTYRKLGELMPDNGIQIIMFTHQSGEIWADMANIVWASGLRVTAAWYVVTETDSALREGSYVKGTVLLVLRKRTGHAVIGQDDLAEAIATEVQRQIESMTGLNQSAKGLYRDENVFEDADIQMAGYGAALRALTGYESIDGQNMPEIALRPRVKGQKTLVDKLIDYAVSSANKYLIPRGIEKQFWEQLNGTERFYLKMLDMEAHHTGSLDNFQNFAKAFAVPDHKSLMASHLAKKARLKSAVELDSAEMSDGSPLYQSTLRAVLYAMRETERKVPSEQIITHLAHNTSRWYDDTQRDLAVALADYIADKRAIYRPSEAEAARVVRELILNQRLG